MRCVNHAVKGGGFLTCSFRENEFGDFLLYKKWMCTASSLCLKTAVSQCGLQLGPERRMLPQSAWVFGPNVIINMKGEQIDPSVSDFVWLSDIHPRTVWPTAPIPVTLPLNSSSIVPLVNVMCTIMRHNIYPALLTLGASVMVLHYSQIVSKRGHCHVLILFGRSQTGKTTALQCALSLFGCHRRTFYSHGTKEAYLQKCCMSTLPVGCDDPQSQAAIGQLIVELFNGAKSNLVKSGDKVPITSCIISANFCLAETAKWVQPAE